jgi:hypothetical protein
VIPTFNQEGRQARKRKKGDEIKKKWKEPSNDYFIKI